MKKLTAILATLALFTTFAVTGTFAEEEKEVPKKPFPSDIAYGETGMGVVFSHEMHVETMGYGCGDCHTEIFKLREGAAREEGDFVMNTMYEGKYCGHCHNGETAFDASDYGNCGTCHNGATPEEAWKLVGPEEDIMLGFEGSKARFSHAVHQEMFGCAECHTDIFPIKFTETITSMDEISEGKSCGTCHNGNMAFAPDDCGTCHPDM